jgi:hypothetical protein
MLVKDTPYKTYDEVKRSKEYFEYFSELKERDIRYTEICNGYMERYKCDYSEFEGKVEQWVKGVGSGGYMERGYYHPSPTQDLVIRGTKRGRLLKLQDDPAKADILFGFDQGGRLIFVKRNVNTKYEEHELLFYEGNRVVGLTVNLVADDKLLQECVFEESKLTQFTHFRPSLKKILNGWQGTDLRREDYSYCGNTLDMVESVGFNCPSTPIFWDGKEIEGIIQRDQCYMKCDEAGRFSEFQRIRFWGPFQYDEWRDGELLRTTKKRRFSDFEKKVLSAYKMR